MSYSATVAASDVIDLPFVADIPIGPRQKRRSFWAVEPTESYFFACARGREYAAQYLAFCEQNPDGADLLTWITLDMGAASARYDVHSDSRMGYIVGFCEFLGGLLQQTARNIRPMAVAQQRNREEVECAYQFFAQREVSA